jgi:hypothetical protein
MLIRFPVFLTIWLVYMFLIKFPTALLGFVVTPFLYRYRHTDYKDLPFWTRPWANPEDWQGQSPDGNDVDSLPRWWHKLHGNGFKSWYKYHAVRNPANGLRAIEAFDMDIDPSRVKFATNGYMIRYEPPEVRALGKKLAVYVAWQGWQAGMKLIYIWNDERHAVIKLGWRVEPRDVHATDPDKMGIADASFAGKILPYRKG